jgi:hypothetical protein
MDILVPFGTVFTAILADALPGGFAPQVLPQDFATRRRLRNATLVPHAFIAFVAISVRVYSVPFGRLVSAV